MRVWTNRIAILHSTSGFSYVEVLVASMLIAITLVPAVNAIFSGTLGGSIHAEQAVDHYRITGKMEEVLAAPFDDLQQAADAAGGPGVVVDAYSDSAGTERRCLVFLSRYDGDNLDGDDDPFTGVDDGLIWVQIQIENTLDSMETLTKR
jgi:hypothetical protein